MPGRTLAALVCTLLATLSAHAAAPAKVIVGANVYDEPFISLGQQDLEIQRLAANGVTTIRTGLSAKSIDFIIRAYQHGIGSIVIVYTDEGSTVKSKGRWSQQPLSGADPQAFSAWLKPLVDQLDAAKVPLTALELGNEINTSGYNGDIPDPGTGRVLGLADLNNPNDPEAPAIVAGYRVYLRVMAVLKDLRDQSRVNRTTPILSGTSANWGLPGPKAWDKKTGVSITDAIEYLRQNGMDKLVDGYAVHDYPSGDPHAPMTARIKELESNIFAACKPGGKPCWLTEWGIGNADQSCPLNDEKRKQAIAAERTAFEQFIRQRRLAAAIFYDWTGLPGKTADPAGIFRCGALTDAGKLALSPLK